VRIQVKRDSGPEPTFRDIIDKGNNVAAVVTRACKNAESRFGHGADIYGKREAVRTEEEKERYEHLLKLAKANISADRARLFQEGWEALGADFSEYLEKWEAYLNKVVEKKSSSAEKASSQIKDGSVTEDKTSQTIMFN